MSKQRGKYVPYTPFRKLVTELMHFSQKVPSVTADRLMRLAPVVEARQQSSPKASWSAIFAKAYGIVARDYPELRRSFLSFPWSRIYEHPHNIVTLNIERELPGEKIVLYCLVRSPENRTLAEIDEIIHEHKTAPLESLRSYTRSLSMSRLPGPLRRFVFWGGLNFFGRRRSHNFGTFGLSSVGAHGAGLLKLIPVLTSTIHYGLFEPNHQLEMRLSWDHRILDGGTIARVLSDMEQVLNGQMVRELWNAKPSAAA